jgi:hypothetical protein
MTASPALLAWLFGNGTNSGRRGASPKGACQVECPLRGDPSPEGATPDVSDRSCDALDGAQPAVGQRGGEVLGFRPEVGDEGLQSDRG